MRDRYKEAIQILKPLHDLRETLWKTAQRIVDAGRIPKAFEADDLRDTADNHRGLAAGFQRLGEQEDGSALRRWLRWWER